MTQTFDEPVSELTSAIASGDPDAFARFYEASFDAVYARAKRIARLDEHDCLDIAQDAYVRMIRSMKPIQDAAALDAWITRVVRSAAYDHLRRIRRRRRRERQRATPAGAAAVGASRALIDDHDLAERLAWLRTRLALLDRAQADLLALRFQAGMTLDQIGRRLGLTPGGVDGRVRRTLGALEEDAQERFND